MACIAREFAPTGLVRPAEHVLPVTTADGVCVFPLLDLDIHLPASMAAAMGVSPPTKPAVPVEVAAPALPKTETAGDGAFVLNAALGLIPHHEIGKLQAATRHGPRFPHRPAVRPEWVDFPLNPDCWSECAPRPDVIHVIEAVLTSFSPGTDPLAWQKVAELVRAAGRTAEECATVGWDELFVVFDIHRERLRSLLGTRAAGARALHISGASEPSPESDSEDGRGPTTCERLKGLWETVEGQCFLRTAKNIGVIAERIRRKPTVVKESPFFQSTVKPARNTHKSFEKFEAAEARDRADRAREETNGRGGRRK